MLNWIAIFTALSAQGERIPDAPFYGAEAEYTGIYVYAFEGTHFRACGEQDVWAIRGMNEEVIDQLAVGELFVDPPEGLYRENEVSPGSIWAEHIRFLRARARLTQAVGPIPEGVEFRGERYEGYGHMGVYDRELLVTEIIVMREFDRETEDPCENL